MKNPHTPPPLEDHHTFSKTQSAFLGLNLDFTPSPGQPSHHSTRHSILNYALLITPRAAGLPNERVLDGLIRNGKSKLHDREPEAVISTLRAIAPDFWNDGPFKDDTRKKAFIGVFARVITGGKSVFSKPNLRKVKVNESAEPSSPFPI